MLKCGDAFDVHVVAALDGGVKIGGGSCERVTGGAFDANISLFFGPLAGRAGAERVGRDTGENNPENHLR